VGDAGPAEDLAQEKLVTAWRRPHRLTETDRPGGAEAWLNAIARNVCRRWLRARGLAPLPVAEPDPGEAHDLDSVLEREELVELLDRALGLLPAATRDALVGHYVEELSHAEIATRLGTSADAVSMRVSRGRSRLRYLLETRFAGDALAEGWTGRYGAGWRATRLRCVDCGRAGVEVRQDDAEVAFRCRLCDPAGLSVHLPLDAPVFGRSWVRYAGPARSRPASRCGPTPTGGPRLRRACAATGRSRRGPTRGPSSATGPRGTGGWRPATGAASR
jgi:RNA polymerase sigma-70 factor (ECF subfamily)